MRHTAGPPRLLLAAAASMSSALAALGGASVAFAANAAASGHAQYASGLSQTLSQTGTRGAEGNLPYLFAVFAITWAGFFAYVFYTSRRQREMQREIDALTQSMDARQDENVGNAAPDDAGE